MGRWFVNQGDALRMNVISSTATAISVFVTILAPDGAFRRVRSNIPFTTNGTRVAETAVTLISTLPEGEVISLNAATFTANIKRGQCYVQVYVIEQPTMAQGYVFANRDVVLDEHTDPGPSGGNGNIIRALTADPAAGSEVADVVVPTNVIWKLHSYSVQLVQGITQTPLPTLRIRNTGSQIMTQIPITTTAISASSTAQLTWARGVVQESFTAIVGDEFHTAPLPDFHLAALAGGDTFGTLTDGIGANTNYGAALYYVEEWLVL